MEGLLTSVVGDFVKATGRVLFGSIYSMINDTVKFQSNLDVLEKEMKDLLDVKDEVKNETKLAETHEKTVRVRVTRWLQEVDELQLKVNQIKAVKLSRWSLNCSKRYRVSKDVAEKLKEIERLLKAGSSHTGNVADNYSMPGAVEHIPGPTIQDQTTSSKTLDKIMTLLSDDEVRRIGIWGMGGVGKTTLVRTLNKKLESISLEQPFGTQPFGIVLWVLVSRKFDEKIVQAEIAERLKLEKKKTEESTRRLAHRIYERLKKEEKFLLILDDVWEEIDLGILGVPQFEDHKGSKIILTTRSLDVCRHMKTDKEVTVAVLNDDESWRLFSANTGNVVSREDIKPWAKAVAKECCGLPLALVTMGAAMKDKKNVKLWEHALHELQRPVSCPPHIADKIYKPLKWSYDSLEDEKIKYCFLYCSLFPEDSSIAISELAQCWLAEGLLDEKENYEDSINRVISLIENLKYSCLLEDGAYEDTVKMHDVVRDVAIWIASSPEDGCESLVCSGIGLSEMSIVELSNPLKRVSFMNNKIIRLPDYVRQCSKASTLLLQGNLPLEIIPETFLQGFEALRVLNMGGTRIHSLPLSLFQLGELRALLLGSCSSLDELPRGLDKLSRLEVLDLSATGIRELPRGLENLSKLKQLNLSSTRHLRTIQAGIISQLSCLEVLDMTGSNYCFSVKRDVPEKMACFDEELKCLERLLVLYIRLERIPCLSSEDLSWTSRLRFQFFVGPQANSVPPRHDKRMTWSLKSLDLSSEEEIGSMLSNADSLDFVNCLELSDMVINRVDRFPRLKSLAIENCSSGVWKGECDDNEYDLLPNLEELYLRRLDYGKSISEVLGHLGLTFLKLKLIQVERCSEMEYLFSYDVPDLETIQVRNCKKLGELFSKFIPPEFPKLKLIEVESCSEMEYLLSGAAPSLEAIKVRNCYKLGELFSYLSVKYVPPGPVLPRLRILYLERLPELRTLCRDKETWPLLEQLYVFKCDLVRKLPLTDENVKNIEEIKGASHWWNALKWDADTTKSSLRPFFSPISTWA